MRTQDYLGLTLPLYQLLWKACYSGDPETIAGLWEHCPEEFADIRVLAHDRTGKTRSSLDALLPVDADLDEVVWLRSLYAAGNLRCYDARTTSNLFSPSPPSSVLRLDPVFLCDTCIVSHCRGLWENIPLRSDVLRTLQAASSLLAQHHWQRFDPACYAHENLERLDGDPVEQEKKMFSRLAGFYLWLRTPASEFASGVVASRGVRAERWRQICALRARERMHKWKQFLAGGAHDRLRLGSKITLLALLRALYERWKPPGTASLAQKVTNLLAFFDERLFTIPKLEIAVALHLLDADELPAFFHPLQPNVPSEKLFRKIGAMAWDLVHLRESALWAAREFSTGSVAADLTVPYLVTADRAYAGFLPAFQIRALMTRRGSSFYETILSQEDVSIQVSKLLGHDVLRFFSQDAKRRRDLHRPATTPARESLLDALIGECESELRLLYKS